MALLLFGNQSGEVREPEWPSPALILFPPLVCALQVWEIEFVPCYLLIQQVPEVGPSLIKCSCELEYLCREKREVQLGEVQGSLGPCWAELSIGLIGASLRTDGQGLSQ